MRERLATLPLDDADILHVAPPHSVPPPPPSFVRPTPHATPSPSASRPPPRVSAVGPIVRGSLVPPPHAFASPAVPSFDVDLGWEDGPTATPVPLPSPQAATWPPPHAWVPPAVASTARPPQVETPSMAPDPFASPRVASPLRLTISDPTDVIFDGIYGLSFARSTGEAAEMCAETLARALRARAVVIHAHDLESGEIRAIGAHGDGDFDILGSAEDGAEDLVGAAVLCNQKAVTMTFDGELPRMAPKRLHAVGAPRRLVASPAMAWGRCLAIIEVIDADESYEARVADSTSYVAEHLAQFLSARAA